MIERVGGSYPPGRSKSTGYKDLVWVVATLAVLSLSNCASSANSTYSGKPPVVPEANGYFLESVTAYDGNDNVVGPIYSYKLDLPNRKITTIYGSVYEFDEHGRITLLRVADPNHTIAYVRDKRGNIIKRIATFANGRLSSTYLTYENDHITQSKVEVSADKKYQTDYQYDKDGRLIKIKEHFDGERECTAFHTQLPDPPQSKINFVCRYLGDKSYAFPGADTFSYLVDSNGNTIQQNNDRIIEEDKENGQISGRIHRQEAAFEKIDSPVPNLDLFDKMQAPIAW